MRVVKIITTGYFLLNFIAVHSQHVSAADSLNTKRFVPLAITGASLYGGSLAVLSTQWYSGYERQPFTFFDDNDEWLQMDKVGHAQTSWFLSDLCYRSLAWSGVKESRAAIYGSLISFSYLSSIELMDAYSKGWGFSVGDMVANSSGSLIFLVQQLRWKEQRIKVKYNFIPSPYAKYRPDVFGVGFFPQALKDYNGQAYWLSTNPGSWRDTRWPGWLNLALGYSANGMTGGVENSFPLLGVDDEVPDFQRTRQFYLSFDIDLNGIPARRNWFKAFRTIFGFVKIPAPAVGIDTQGSFLFGIR